MKDSLAAALETVAASGVPEIIEYAFATPLGISRDVGTAGSHKFFRESWEAR